MRSYVQDWIVRVVTRGARVFYPSGVVALTETLRRPQGILLVPSESLRDVLHTLPVVRVLRRAFPEAPISLMARADAADLFKEAPGLNEVILCYPLEPPSRWKAFRQVVSEIRARHFDTLFSLDHHHDPVKALLGYLSGAKVRVGFRNGVNRDLYNILVDPPAVEAYLADRNLTLLRSVGIDTSGIGTDWTPSDRERRIAEQLVDLRGLSQSELLVAFEAETDLCRDRPVLGHLSRALREELSAKFIVVQESPPAAYSQETDLVRPGEGVDLACRTIRDALAILSCCDVFLCRNTNLLHFAVAMGVPTLALLPRSVPDRIVPPASERLVVVRESQIPETQVCGIVRRLVAGRGGRGRAGDRRP